MNLKLIAVKFATIIIFFLALFSTHLLAQPQLSTKSKRAIKCYQDALSQANLYNLEKAISLLEEAIVIDKKFKDIKSTEQAVGQLPPEIAAGAKIISQWDADTVFFNRRAMRY